MSCVFAPCLVVLLTPFLTSEIESTVYAYVAIYYVCLVNHTLVVYTHLAWLFISEMRNYHRSAYKNHISSLFWLFIATVICLCCLLGYQVCFCLNVLCTRESREYGIEEDDLIKVKEGICTYLGTNHFTFETLAAAEIIWTTLILVSILAFFVLDTPHDCYVCLGKDPDRIYSGFQLNLEQRARRNYRARFNA